MKTVIPITDTAVITTLRLAARLGPTPYIRERAHAILLSNRGYTLEQIADFFENQYQTISRWIDDWEDLGIRGLYKKHGGGASHIYNSEEVERFKQLVKEEPRRIRHAKAVLEEETQKESSLNTLRRMAKSLGMVFKRVRRSCRHKRDQEHFERCQAALKDAKEAEDKGLINLFYFDESGFSQEPCVPYAWQQKGEQLRIPSVKSKRINVLGFMNRSNDLFYYPVIGMVDSQVVIDVFKDFADQMADQKYSSGDRYTVVMVDNASIHTSKLFREELADWAIEKKVLVCYLPTYSPELNLIEKLWEKVKYEWLNLFEIMDFATFEAEVKRVFDQFGQEYMISFG